MRSSIPPQAEKFAERPAKPFFKVLVFFSLSSSSSSSSFLVKTVFRFRMTGNVHPLQTWFARVGIELHPALYLHSDSDTGLSFYTSEPLASDTTVIRVPSTICITSRIAFDRIQLLLEQPSGPSRSLDIDALPRADWVLLYLVLSRLAAEYLAIHPQESRLEGIFTHLPYVTHIPTTIETPLHFSPSELALLSNTPLVGSTERRLGETIVDYRRATTLLLPLLAESSFTSFLSKSLSPIAEQQLARDALMQHTRHDGLELWRWSESAFTSRSFPPRLIGDAETTPILIPGYDTFNHARAHGVTWTYSPPSPSTGKGGMVDLTLNYPVDDAATQVWNNYGGKSNEEFLSGYGFCLDSGDEDTLALKIGGDARGSDGTTHYWVRTEKLPQPDTADQDASDRFVRAPCPCPSLLQDLEQRLLQGDASPTDDVDRLQLYASILETLERLLLAKRRAFRASQREFDAVPPPSTTRDGSMPPQQHAGWPRVAEGVRASVWSHVKQYRAGQMHLLNAAVEWTRRELERVADQLDAMDDDDEEEEEDEEE